MSNESIELCPACNSKLEQLASSGDYAILNCPKHGEFYVSGTVITMFQKGSKTVLDNLPELVEKRAGKGIDEMITSYSFPSN
ncbi:TPA: hypothetical protein QHR98_001911 [Klebsiella aerogenes]|nr:hypothetical protein [Klebsiella aerogenes]